MFTEDHHSASYTVPYIFNGVQTFSFCERLHCHLIKWWQWCSNIKFYERQVK